MPITTLAEVKLAANITDTSEDARISAKISRAEQDYLSLRGIPFELDTDGSTIVYPDGASDVAAEMVCYLLGIGDYYGRGIKSESEGGTSYTYDDKIRGYPRSIVGTIERFQRVL